MPVFMRETDPSARGKSAHPWKQRFWGLLLVLILTLVALRLSELPVRPFTLPGGRHPIEPVILAIVLGMLVGNLVRLPAVSRPGIKFAIQKLLPLGIVLLGARLNFLDVLKVGLAGLLLSVGEIVVALGLVALLTRQLGLPGKLGTLLGVGTAICGGTAIVATAPVIEAKEKDVAFSVATVTLLGSVAMFLLPLVGRALELGSSAFGIWAGLAIHQTPQVVAAGFAYSPQAGETATIIKLARVCLLAPVVFVIGLAYGRRVSCREITGGAGAGERPGVRHTLAQCWEMFPRFVPAFLFVALLRTLGLLPDLSIPLGGRTLDVSVPKLAEEASKFCIVLSMAAVGLETKFGEMRQTGVKPFLVGLAAAVCIALLSLAAILVLQAAGPGRWS